MKEKIKQARKDLPKNRGDDGIKARKDLPKNGWGKVVLSVILMLVWVFASVIGSQFIVSYLMLWIVGVEKLQEAVWMTVYSALSYTLAMFLVILVPRIIAKRRRSVDDTKLNKPSKIQETERTDLGLKGLPTWTDIGLAPIGFFVYLILAGVLVSVFAMAFPWFNVEEAQEIGFNVYAVGLDRIVAFFTLVVVAPIAEEIIFRGWLYGKMREKFCNKISDRASMLISIFLVSLLFGIVHLQWNVGVNVFAMSVILCGLREITGTIYSGILLHMLKNGVAFYLLFVLGIA